MIDVGVIGLGLIGGSIAMNLAQGLSVAGYDIDQHTLELAYQKKAIDYPASTLSEFCTAKLIFIATPPLHVPGIVDQLRLIVSPQTIITDCASVKRSLYEEGRRDLGENFVGGHPMAGREVGGFENARADLFENAAWILTPTSVTGVRALEFMVETVQTFGAKPVIMNPEEHDRAVALVSHVPHLLASTMVQMATKDGSATVAAGAWEGLTRVASADPQLWSDIILANADFIADRMEEMVKELQKVVPLVRSRNRDDIYSFLELGKKVREDVTKSRG